MFCSGQCRKGKKRCGQLMDLIMETTLNGRIETIEKCCFHGILESLHRAEQADIRIQAAIESSRNENVNYSNKTAQTIATGFLGLIHTMDDSDKKDRIIKILNNIDKDNLKIEER